MTSPHFTARGPEDLLAVVPFALGFQPDDSVVLMTFSDESFYARVDLPVTEEERDQVGRMLLQAVVRNRVTTAALIVYTDDEELARAACVDLVAVLVATGVDVVDALRADGSQWWRPLELEDGGTDYDVSCHRFTAERVLLGDVALADRQQVADSLVGTDPEAIEAVQQAVESLDQQLVLPDQTPSFLAAEALWLRARLSRFERDGERPDATDAARLLVDVEHPPLRDVAWCPLTRATAGRHVELWRDVLRRAPYDLVPGAAAVLAFAAWLDGDGALAWCAIDRCQEVSPGHSLADLVSTALSQAVSPATWTPVPDLLPAGLREAWPDTPGDAATA